MPLKGIPSKTFQSFKIVVGISYINNILNAQNVLAFVNNLENPFTGKRSTSMFTCTFFSRSD